MEEKNVVIQKEAARNATREEIKEIERCIAKISALNQ
jgi:hypothetical protein